MFRGRPLCGDEHDGGNELITNDRPPQPYSIIPSELYATVTVLGPNAAGVMFPNPLLETLNIPIAHRRDYVILFGKKNFGENCKIDGFEENENQVDVIYSGIQTDNEEFMKLTKFSEN